MILPTHVYSLIIFLFLEIFLESRLEVIMKAPRCNFTCTSFHISRNCYLAPFGTVCHKFCAFVPG